MDDIMAEPAEKPTTVDEFLRWDDGTDTRYELIDGRIFAMAPPYVHMNDRYECGSS